MQSWPTPSPLIVFYFCDYTIYRSVVFYFWLEFSPTVTFAGTRRWLTPNQLWSGATWLKGQRSTSALTFFFFCGFSHVGCSRILHRNVSNWVYWPRNIKVAAIIRAGQIPLNAKERCSTATLGSLDHRSLSFSMGLLFPPQKEKEREPSHNTLWSWCNFGQILFPWRFISRLRVSVGEKTYNIMLWTFWRRIMSSESLQLFTANNTFCDLFL